MFTANPALCPHQASQIRVYTTRGEIPESRGERRENHQPATTAAATTRKCQGNPAET